MFLASGEIAERKRIFRAADHAQIGLDAGAQTDTGLGRAARDNAFHERVPDEKFRDRFGRFGRDDEIEIAHDFPSPAITPGNADARGVRVRAQILLQLFRLGRDLAELETARVPGAIRNR